MTGTLETVAAFSPGLFWLWYTHKKDRHEPEPLWLVSLVFGLGCAATFAVLLMRPHLDGFIPAGPKWLAGAVDAFLVTSFVEESLKLLAFFVLVWWTRYLSEPMDGLVYGAAVGLGFASFENALYLARSEDLMVLGMRAFTATVLHACLTSGVALCFTMARLEVWPRHGYLLASAGLLGAIVLHGLYDLFLFTFPWLKMISLMILLPLIIAIMGLATRWCQRASRRFHADAWPGS